MHSNSALRRSAVSGKIQLEISKLLNTIGLKHYGAVLWNDVFHLTPLEELELSARRLGVRLVKTQPGEQPDKLAPTDAPLRPLYHRGTPADVGTLRQIFVEGCYSLDKLRRGAELVALYQDMCARGQTPLILDAGANIGASAVWFAKSFPESRILAFEPEQRNYDLLVENTAGLNVQPFKEAVGSRDGFVSIVDPGEGECGYRTKADTAGSIKVSSMRRVVEESIAEGLTPFIAKIDIEGGEAQLFSEMTDWVERFPILIIELHDWLINGEANSRNFLKCVSRYDRDFVHIGENIFSIKNL